MASIIHATLTLLDSATNEGAFKSQVAYVDGTSYAVSNGGKTLSGVLTQLRLTTVNGTDVLGAGKANILIKG